ncbi:ATP-binding protein [Synechococcus sp. PCC 7336]|uniref:sensor histidine kinase n=1 Tax=Synechococcus sp. PCC 7336 TaxID=195250 RepID=UPI00034BDF60|nr:ATP-binding protein [Synechococcus sp. PCC 7336]
MDKPLRVLIVEDSEDDALLTVRLLRRGGYRVEFERVETATAMQTALKKQTWDLAIADYTLPQFSAPAALALLQSMQIDLPFIVVSGTIGEDRAVAAMKLGAHDYLMKGQWARLLPAVERELREARERRQRRMAEQGLRRSEQRFRALIENASDIILLLDRAGSVQYASPSVRRSLDIDPQQTLGQPFADWLHPDDRTPAAKILATVLAADGTVQTAEWRWRHRQGDWRVFEAIVKRFDDATRFSGCVVCARDITARLQIEEMRRALERERELTELKLRFFSMASHEFRTPLSVILMAAQMLEHSEPEWLDAKKLRNLHRIQDAAKSMSQMLTDILTIARAEAQKLEFDPQPLNLFEECRQIVEEMESTDAQQSSSIQFVCSGRGDGVCLDRKLLHSILTNLLSNARKYSPAGAEVALQVSVGEEVVTFEIADRGIGILAGDRDRLFELFYRGGNVGQIEGSGLGLAVVKKCVDRHGGSVLVAGAEGEGTTFVVRIPVTEGDNRSD